jgi:hypothetical protein
VLLDDLLSTREAVATAHGRIMTDSDPRSDQYELLKVLDSQNAAQEHATKNPF